MYVAQWILEWGHGRRALLVSGAGCGERQPGREREMRALQHPKKLSYLLQAQFGARGRLITPLGADSS